MTETYEINGFVIDTFNQYNLEQKKQGIPISVKALVIENTLDQ